MIGKCIAGTRLVVWSWSWRYQSRGGRPCAVELVTWPDLLTAGSVPKLPSVREL